MTLKECNSCKKQVRAPDQYNAPRDDQDWIEFSVNTGTEKKPVYLEIHLCPDCLKKVLQFLHIVW